MSRQETPRNFMHPEIANATLSPMQRAMVLRKEVHALADNQATHPFTIIQELRLSRADNPLKALEIQEKYSEREAYVGDIHGLTEANFSKLRASLLTGGFDNIFFIGDIGGSEKLSKLQRLFYQGEDNLTSNKLYNRQKQLVAEGADESRMLEGLSEGYRNIYAYEKELEGHGKISPDEARRLADELPDEDILQGLKKIQGYQHYGHYVSNLPDQAIIALASDVEGYYDRFAQMAAEIRLNTKAKVYVLRGNWDARLPFDFERDTEKPVAFPPEKRRFQDDKYFKDHGIPYFSNLDLVTTQEAVHVLVPFDSVAQGVDVPGGILSSERVTRIQKAVERAREEKKRVIMVAHAVPAWEMHRKPTNNEGKETEKNLRELLSAIEPDEVVYGHEHVIRQDENKNPLPLDTKYRFTSEGAGVVLNASDESLQDLDRNVDNGRILATHVPVPGEPFNGVATVDVPKWPVKDKRPRGTGGKSSPVRVGRAVVPLKEIGNKLPTGKILSPDVAAKIHSAN